ncbi:MAG: sugar phosphate isomerase/epimerase [Saprospiraceae bacterium]|nr:sugar phosphate isomerase/epimerase [Saprospiraceae bacterium]
MIRFFSSASVLYPFYNLLHPVSLSPGEPDELRIYIFSKHLQFLNWKQTGMIAKDLGFDGIDLTVRKNGHVDPNKAPAELPEALKDIRSSGIDCDIITTKVEDIDKVVDKQLIKTAAQNGIKYYRLNWYNYLEDKNLLQSIDYYQDKINAISKLNKQYDIIGTYQNHSGTKIGASYWEVYNILKDSNSQFMGAQYDIRHAVAEGGRSWTNGFKLLAPLIKTIVLKDFKWGLVNGKWKIVNTPIGEGMVDFQQYFKLLKEFNINVPVILHLEYPLGGAEKGNRILTVDKSKVFEAMRSDLQKIKQLWKNS